MSYKMVEGGISEFFKWWIYLLLVFGALALFLFFYQVGQTNRFASFVSAEIERGGVQVVGNLMTVEGDSGDETFTIQELGFTPEAETRIREENENNYNGRYDVTLTNEVEADTVLGYGDLVDFEVTGDYQILFDWFRAPILKSTDQAIIQVRMAGSDGERIFTRSMFEYEDFVYHDHEGIGFLTGFSELGVNKYNVLRNQGLLIDFIVPDKNPTSNITITHIADGAFDGYAFKGDFIAPNVKVIGQRAFAMNSFDGDFNAPNVLSVGDGAFIGALFTGDFVANSVLSVGASAFDESLFNGTFNASRIETIGARAFRQAKFTGSFNTPFVTAVGERAFEKSDFEGYFNAPEIETIGANAFMNSDFLNGTIQGNQFVAN